MTTKQLQKRNSNAENLKTFESLDGQFFVESDKGVIPKLDDRFIINIKGKDFVLYAGVLDLATQKGLLKLEVELLQFPTKENGNEAICRAIAESKTGEVFSDIGDANPKNCHELIVKHLIRMASTRAKGRCLRDMCNISIACLEEIADFDDVLGSESGNSKPKVKNQSAKITKTTEGMGKADSKADSKTNKKTRKKSQPTKNESRDVQKAEKKSEANDLMSEAQRRAVENLTRRKGLSETETQKMVLDTYGKVSEDLSAEEASDLIRNLQKKRLIS